MRLLPLLLLLLTFATSCKKDQTPPDLYLKADSGYTSSDVVISPGSTFLVGIDAKKTTDDLNLFYTEVAYDGANTTRLISRIYVSDSQKEHYTNDVTVTTRNQPGTERWVFNINDKDGRITKKEIKVTVQ